MIKKNNQNNNCEILLSHKDKQEKIQALAAEY
jgi:hypothetical protein